MIIIPAINCENFECVEEKFKKSAEFLQDGGWVQLDIADGKFTGHKTWNNPKEFQLLITNYQLPLNIEVHLMVEKPEEMIRRWVAALRSTSGQGRIIAHLEALKSDTNILIHTNDTNVELGLAINPQTPVEELIPFLEANRESQSANRIKFIQILAVGPGKSGQEFDKSVLEKIKFLKKTDLDVKIEVDGGINLETAKLCKEAGADILVAGSYIFNDSNPREAYERLASI